MKESHAARHFLGRGGRLWGLNAQINLDGQDDN